MITISEPDNFTTKALDLLLVPRQTYEDLLALIGGSAPTDHSPRTPAESQALVERLLDCWRILPSITQQTFEESLRKMLAPAEYARLRNAWIAVSAFGRAQFAGAQAVVEAFERSGIRYSLLKGIAAGYRLYPQPFLRTSWDVDVGVFTEELGAAEDLAYELGFRPAQKNFHKKRFERADPGLRTVVESQHYELGFLVRRLQVTNLTPEMLEAIRAVRAEPWTHQFWEDVDSAAPWCYSIIDIHHAISLDVRIEELLLTRQSIRWENSIATIPDDAWLAAHLIFKIYWEGVHNYGKGLYQFADMVRILPFLDDEKFGSLIAALEQYNMIAAGHYVLRRLPAFGVDLPEHVSSFIRDTFTPPAGSDPSRLNDLGDMWARLWGQR